MSEVTVAQFAEVLKVPSIELLTQLDEAGITVQGADDVISDDAKMELLTICAAAMVARKKPWPAHPGKSRSSDDRRASCSLPAARVAPVPSTSRSAASAPMSSVTCSKRRHASSRKNLTQSALRRRSSAQAEAARTGSRGCGGGRKTGRSPGRSSGRSRGAAQAEAHPRGGRSAASGQTERERQAARERDERAKLEARASAKPRPPATVARNCMWPATSDPPAEESARGGARPRSASIRSMVSSGPLNPSSATLRFPIPSRWPNWLNRWP